MEVKEVLRKSEPTELNNQPSPVQFQRSIKSISVSVSEKIGPESVRVNIETRPRSVKENESRTRANQAISVVNIAAEATTEIERLVRSIDGIVEQAAKDNTTPQRRAVLQKEAQGLVDEIKNRAQVTTNNGVRPLAGDKIRLDIEEKLGKALEILLPDQAKESFGIGQIDFSLKDTIIEIKAKVAKAREQIENIKKQVDDTKSAVESVVNTLDVALQNSEASEASVRDLDAALNLAGQTRLSISANPNAALESVGRLQGKSLGQND